jgi:hypothetical protein
MNAEPAPMVCMIISGLQIQLAVLLQLILSGA